MQSKDENFEKLTIKIFENANSRIFEIETIHFYKKNVLYFSLNYST